MLLNAVILYVVYEKFFKQKCFSSPFYRNKAIYSLHFVAHNVINIYISPNKYLNLYSDLFILPHWTSICYWHLVNSRGKLSTAVEWVILMIQVQCFVILRVTLTQKKNGIELCLVSSHCTHYWRIRLFKTDISPPALWLPTAETIQHIKIYLFS